MKKDIKSEIMETGLSLFRKQGYTNVSMRNIADALGISVGNLTYHFNKKEDLIEAVFVEQYKNFEAPPTPTTLKELNDFFLRGIEDYNNNDYFFRFYDELPNISPKVYEMQVSAILKRRNKLQDSFRILQQKGYLQKEEIPGQIGALIDVINLIKVYWSPSQEALPSAIDTPVNCLWSMIYPRLTEKGKTAFKEEVQC